MIKRLDLWVPGHPKTKGSLDFVNGRRAVENVAGSKRWRQLVAYRARYNEERGSGLAAPIVGPVAVGLQFYVATAVAVRKHPGDVDKLARNVLDALQDAGVYLDDAQVQRLWVSRQPENEHCRPGVRIVVYELP